MPTPPALTPAAALEAKSLYLEVDERGRRLWSLRRLAKHFAVSESTIERAVHGLGPYMAIPPGRPPAAWDAQAEASLDRLHKLLEESLRGQDQAPQALARCPYCGKPADAEAHAYGTRGYACDAHPATQ